MSAAEAPIQFTRLADGTTLCRQPDGSFRPVTSETDLASLAAISDAEIECMAANDPDHPGLDDAFWKSVDRQTTGQEAGSITLDQDILSYFQRQGQGYQTRINSVLRNYVEARQRTRT